MRIILYFRRCLLIEAKTRFYLTQVLETNPIPGLVATPANGVIQSGGFSEITLSMTPVSMVKFDARINVAIHGGRVQEIRLGGAVEAPSVNIDVVSVISCAN